MIVKIGHKKCAVKFILQVADDVQKRRRFITTCTIIDEQHQVFTGVAIKAPDDRHFAVMGQKTALRRAFGQMHSSLLGINSLDFSLTYEKLRVDVLGAEPE